MKKNLYRHLMVALGLGLFVSCSNEMNDPTQTPEGVVTPSQSGILVRTPEISAWSGKTVLGTTVSTRGTENTPAEITQAEIDAAKAYFNAKDDWREGNGKELEIGDLSDWKNYYSQEVASGNTIPLEVAQIIGTNNETISEISVWNINADEVLEIITDENGEYDEHVARKLLDLTGNEVIEDHQIKDFSFETRGYDINNTLYENVRRSGSSESIMSPNYRIAELPGYDGVYVAFYGYTNQNNGYWDRIIKLTKVEAINEPVEGPENEEITGNDVPQDKIMHNNEVEVNLSLLDAHANNSIEDLVSKLSIHVRYPHDVKVRIPVPTEILVPADDLDIVLSHKELLESYGKEHNAMFDIAGKIVYLNVNFENEETDCAGNGTGGYYMEITTKGINLDVMKYCLQNYGDGINFEVYNYYQWNVTDQYGFTSRRKPTQDEIDDLKDNWLNKSSVEFGFGGFDNWHAFITQDNYPYYFINAFTNDPDLEEIQNSRDCDVKVIEGQVHAYLDYYVGSHLNGSNWNKIYIRDDVFGTDLQDDAHTEHNVQNSVR